MSYVNVFVSEITSFQLDISSSSRILYTSQLEAAQGLKTEAGLRIREATPVSAKARSLQYSLSRP